MLWHLSAILSTVFIFSTSAPCAALGAQSYAPTALATSDLLVITRQGDHQEFKRCDYAQRKCHQLSRVSIASLQKLQERLESMDWREFPESEWTRTETLLGSHAEVGGSILMAMGIGSGLVSLPGLIANRAEALSHLPVLSAYVVGLSLAGYSLLAWHHSIEKRAKKRSKVFLLSIADSLTELTRADGTDGESQVIALPPWLWKQILKLR